MELTDTEEYWRIIEEELADLAEKGHPKRPWSPREEDVLRRYHGRVIVRDLARILGRSVASVECKARRLEL